MSEQRVSPFANGSEYMIWTELNCERCIKLMTYDDNPQCEINYHLSEAAFDDGTIPHEIAQRMGRLDHPVNEIFQCHEFEAKESDQRWSK